VTLAGKREYLIGSSTSTLDTMDLRKEKTLAARTRHNLVAVVICLHN
jgi:hypothetical protein